MFTPDGRGIVYTSWSLDAPRLGIIYCLNRPSTLWFVPLSPSVGGESVFALAVQLAGTTHQSARGAMFTPPGTQLLWLQNAVGGPHAAASAIMAGDWQPSNVLGSVHELVSVPLDADTPAVHVQRLPLNAWVSVSSRR